MRRHFLTLMDLSPVELRRVIERAMELKARSRLRERYLPLEGRILAMIFDKSSTRTRVSFEAAMTHLGGSAIFLTSADTQLGRGEPVEDTSQVLSRMVDVVVIRTTSHEMVETFAAHSRVPVINGLTDRYHPCQLLADVQTYREQRGEIRGRTVAWVGDGNNVCHSWINAARQFGFDLRIATPPGYAPAEELVHASRGFVALVDTPRQAVEGVDIVVTDTWASMGDEDEKERRQKDFDGYTVDQSLMNTAHPDAVFMHCLPAYRGLEVSAEVMDGPRSLVFDQAENRMHAQKALLEFLLVPGTR
ncbi:MAG: ornithine carbamoyltransferase [Gammaproteobacteria bacterium]|nr:ornithine carbamoyltransferase [Gammaproteobacteria bacterium]